MILSKKAVYKEPKMYRNNRFRPRHFGARKQGGFRVKTFDPSHVVNNAQQVSEPEEEYVPKNSFSDFAIAESLKSNITSHGFSTPTPIQDQTIPLILEGRDVVGLANTGTGKTAAFLIPLINKVVSNHNARVLIIVPTRELAVQIESELAIFTRNLRIFSAVCIGGVSMHGQIRKLQNRPAFVIGTPGRLLDLKRQRRIDFGQFSSVVLDEVDRMLDMGFVKDIQQIIHELPGSRQSLFFSATMGANILPVMQQFTTNATTISVKSKDSVANVHQEVLRVNGRAKIDVLQQMLFKQEFEKVLVFSRTKRGAEKLSRDLSNKGLRVSAIHGNKSQNQRQKSLDMFKSNRINILIATDVVARGIDVDNITHVINYELPESYEQYLHRIGRTGRAGKNGVAISFVE